MATAARAPGWSTVSASARRSAPADPSVAYLGSAPGPSDLDVHGVDGGGLYLQGVKIHRWSGLPISSASIATPLGSLVGALGEPAYRARQLYSWLYEKRAASIDDMTDLPQGPARAAGRRPRRALARGRGARGLRRRHREVPLPLDDGATIESVFIPEERRRTICISTQAGCPLKCAFCLTGIGGYKRNLKPWEILGQVAVVMADAPPADMPWNIVIMGMGEPLLNYEATVAALRVLMDREGFAVSPRKLTLSTVGILPALEKLMLEPVRPNLAISLHASNKALRRELMPIEEPLRASRTSSPPRSVIRSRSGGRGDLRVRRCSAGVNDTPAHARELARLLRGSTGKVNLIPLNPAPEIPFAPPTPEAVDAFCRILAEADVTVSVRRPRGQDILAACGQLHLKREAAPAPARLLKPLAAVLAARRGAAARLPRRGAPRAGGDLLRRRRAGHGRERRLPGPALPGRAVLRQAAAHLLADGRVLPRCSASPDRRPPGAGGGGARAARRHRVAGAPALRPRHGRRGGGGARHHAPVPVLRPGGDVRHAADAVDHARRGARAWPPSRARRRPRHRARPRRRPRPRLPDQGPDRPPAPGARHRDLGVAAPPTAVARPSPRAGLAAFAVVGLAWFALVYRRLGAAPLEYFFLRENLERFAGETYDAGRSPSYYLGAYLAVGLPWSLLFPRAACAPAPRASALLLLWVGLMLVP